MPVRYDAGGRLSKARRTSIGGARIPAALTRTGVFSYFGPDGREVREYRPAEEVFHADSLVTLLDAPVTDDHPPGLVTPSNYRQYARGQVASEARQDGEQVTADLTVNDMELLERVDSGEKAEVSCGYRCDIDPTPGVTDTGERYDRVQRNIRYNHVAIVKRGRAGSDVRLRLDSAGDVVLDTEKSMDKIVLDGATYPLTTAAEIQSAGAALARVAERAEKRVDTAEAELKQVVSKLEQAEAKLEQAEKRADAAEDPQRIDAAVQARVAFMARAKELKADVKFDSGDREVMVACIKAVDPSFEPGERSDDALRAVFDYVRPSQFRHPAAPATSAPAENRADKKDDEDRFAKALAAKRARFGKTTVVR